MEHAALGGAFACILYSLISYTLQGPFDTSGRGKKKSFEWNDRRRSSIVAWLYYIIAMANSSNNNVILLCVRQHINGCAHSPRSLYCSAASPPNDDNDDNDYYSYYYYYDDDDDIITIIYNNNMVAMSISSRSRNGFLFYLRPVRTMNANSFIRSAAVRGWLVTRRGARHPWRRTDT
jgi:hypothetical protein